MEKTSTIKEHRTVPKFLLWCGHVWTAIITIGVTSDMPLWERKRTRLLNGICIMATAAFIGFCLSYTAPDYRVVFWESFQAAIFYLIPILFNYYKRHTLAAHLFCIYTLICFAYFAISHGSVDGAEYFLLTSGMAAMLFFRSTRTVMIYFLLNLIVFWICKYSFTVMKPFVHLPNGENTYIPNLTLLFIISFLIVYYFKTENTRQEALLQKESDKLLMEKKKSDGLLLNILPYETAEELKQSGTARARKFDRVTVMFTDFENFTGLAATIPPEQLVALVNNYFSAFDMIITKHKIEKIKTIGDSYMCAGGLPEANVTNPIDVVRAALEIQQYMQKQMQERAAVQEPYFELRLGIHTGPIVAGIVGLKKFAYDIWGDTVNLASRMESSGHIGKINISKETYLLVKDQFECTYRGKIAVKNKGEMDMYFVEKERI